MKQLEMKKYDFEHGGISRQTALSGISGPSGFNNKENHYFPMKHSNTSKKTQIEILNEEIKSVVLEKHEFENRDESIIIFSRFWTTTILMQERDSYFSAKPILKNWKRLTATSGDQIKPVVMGEI